MNPKPILVVDEATAATMMQNDTPPQHDTTKALAASLMAAALAGPIPLPGALTRGPSAFEVRHDPSRPKTPEDLAAMEAAQRKREAKAARRQKGKK